MMEAGAPSGYCDFSAVWTESEMIVWSGGTASGITRTGARYDPAADAWSPVSAADAPSARMGHTAIATGDLMIVWGGEDLLSKRDDGGRYGVSRSNADGVNLAPVAMASLPFEDTNIDLAGALPGGLSGSVMFQVVDTDRSPGQQWLDTVSLDEIFVRSIP